MRQQHSSIEAAGGQVLAITFEDLERATAYARRHDFPFTFLSDTEMRAYDAYGLRRGALADMLNPIGMWQYLRLILLARGHDRPPRDVDPRQMGGDFVVDAAGRLAFVHRQRYPTDRPSGIELVSILRRARAR